MTSFGLTTEYVEAIQAHLTWLEARPDVPNFDALGEIELRWHDERVGFFRDVDGWWEYVPGK